GGKRYFEELAQIRPPSATDWFTYAFNLADGKQYSSAGDAYLKAADTADDKEKAKYYTWAAENFAFADRNDDSLSAARKAVKLPVEDVRNSASAYRTISDILNERGVYDEALSAAEEAVNAEPNNHRNHFSRAN